MPAGEHRRFTANCSSSGFLISERTVARYLKRVRHRGDPARRWLAFLENHRDVIVAIDFFTVPTLTFQLLYCLFIIEHGRRRILHFNVTAHPTSEWIVQQLREAFPEARPHRYLSSSTATPNSMLM